MLPNLVPDMQLAERLFETLRERTADVVGVTREAYGAGEEVAHAIVREEAAALALEMHNDHAGNLYMTLPGADRAAKRVMVGSHLDSVPRGGNYDGAAGVVAGLAAVAGMRRAGFVPARDITVMVTRAEEGGAWFAAGYPGARAALGILPENILETTRRDTGRSLADHMRELGFDPEAVRAGRRELGPDNVAAFLELHIEQGPLLDSAQIPVGIVTALPGNRRHRDATVRGEWNHSGATPRAWRRDAAIAAAELAYRLDQAWAELDGQGRRMVCTFCTFNTHEDASMAKIAGEVRFGLDIRSPDQATIDEMYRRLDGIIADVEQRRGVMVDLGPATRTSPTVMDQGVQAGLARAADALGIAYRSMPSGGGHDTSAFVQAGVPAGMLFVRNQNGSHNPDEALRMEDFAQACAVVSQWAVQASGDEYGIVVGGGEAGDQGSGGGGGGAGGKDGGAEN
jgi:N-carbamoyl-L-amino-acid hydrolase